MKRLLLTALLLVMFLSRAVGEAPARLSETTTLQEAAEFIDFAVDADGKPWARGVTPGRVRHMAQVKSRPGFCYDYWVNDEWDLAKEKSPGGRKYGYYAGNMCTRAVYCEMLSYFGIDLTPVAMSTLMNDRNVDNPYDTVTALIPGLKRTAGKGYPDFNDMYDLYVQDEHYSPIMLIMQYRGSSNLHTVLVLSQQEDGVFICLDTGYHPAGGKAMWVFRLRLTANRAYVLYSMVDQYNDMTVRACYQWHYDPDEAAVSP